MQSVIDIQPPGAKITTGGPARTISRRAFSGQIVLILGACLAGCTPVKILLEAFPDRFKDDPALIDDYLRAFVVTVIPGAPINDPDLVRIYTDEYYPFHPHCRFFVSDLASRSAGLCGNERFARLDPGGRTRVIRDGLCSDAVISRLYQAAIFMAQVSFFGSIYDDSRGVPLIDYPGTEVYHSPEELYYPDTARYLAVEVTPDGNYG